MGVIAVWFIEISLAKLVSAEDIGTGRARLALAGSPFNLKRFRFQRLQFDSLPETIEVQSVD